MQHCISMLQYLILDGTISPQDYQDMKEKSLAASFQKNPY